ncbi:MAG: hypothetical protein ACRDKW_15560 [Actinomycetota bacterium]
MSGSRMHATNRIRVALAAAPLVLAGCAKGNSPSTAEPSAGAGAENEQALQAQLAKYCPAVVELETAAAGLDQAESEEEARAYYNEEMKPVLQEIQANAPDEIRETLDGLVASIEKLLAGGEVSAAEEQRADEAEDRLHAHDLEHCGWNRVDVTGSDYAFAGIPPTVPAGTASIEIENKGAEVHEMVVFKKKAGVTDSLDSLLAIEEQEEAAAKIEPVGYLGGVHPGDQEFLLADLTAGDYAVVCFYPVGTTPEKFAAEEAEPGQLGDDAHFTKGMRAEFRVTG